MIVHAQKLLVSDFVRTYLPTIRSAVFSYFLDMTEKQCKTLNQNAVHRMMMLMEQLLSSIQSDNDVHEVIETFYLRFAYKLIRSPFLPRRIRGANDIKDTIVLARKKVSI